MSRFENIAVFEDTVSVCEKSSRLIESIKTSRKTQIFIGEGKPLSDASKTPRFEKEAEIIISKKRTFEAAQDYAKLGEKVAVLNFASSTNPGGGVVNGAGAQEECLCRCSTLYFNLTEQDVQNQFHKKHRYDLKNGKLSVLYNDDCVFTPGVTVFKTDTNSPELMEKDDWYQVDVITCAAPNLRNVPSNIMNPDAGEDAVSISKKPLKELHVKRTKRILDIAKAEGEEVVVLGAFGCGAFQNPPEVVAEAMFAVAKEYLRDFRAIEFAIYCTPGSSANYKAFLNELRKIEG